MNLPGLSSRFSVFCVRVCRHFLCSRVQCGRCLRGALTTGQANVLAMKKLHIMRVSKNASAGQQGQSTVMNGYGTSRSLNLLPI